MLSAGLDSCCCLHSLTPALLFGVHSSDTHLSQKFTSTSQTQIVDLYTLLMLCTIGLIYYFFFIVIAVAGQIELQVANVSLWCVVY